MWRSQERAGWLSEVARGRRLTKDEQSALLGVLSATTEREVKRCLAQALLSEAFLADDADLVTDIARARSSALLAGLERRTDHPIGNGALRRLLHVTELASDDLQQALARALREALFRGTDITPASERLLLLLANAGTSPAARDCLVAALVKEGATLAEAAFVPALRQLAGTKEHAGESARDVLLAVDATKGRWSDVDAALAGVRTPDGALRAARALLSAGHARVAPDERNPLPPIVAFLGELVDRLEPLIPKPPKTPKTDPSRFNPRHRDGTRASG